MIGQFSLYQCKGMPGTAALHIFCNLVSKLCLVMKQVNCNCKDTGNKSFYNALLLDTF